MQISEHEYYRSRSAAEWQLAKSAAHPEAQRRHAELAQLYSEHAGLIRNQCHQNKCCASEGELLREPELLSAR